MKDHDTGLETLLSLNGETFPMDNDYWVKFEVKRVEVNEKTPHGMRYSLTLHDRNNNRVFGIDNAHGFKPIRKRYGAKKVAWDHQHKQERVLAYEFESPAMLLTYFWKEVDKILARLVR